MKRLKELLCENEQLSFTRVIAALGWIAFLVVTGYLVYNNTSWTGYDTFASLTGGGGAATQIANKLINSKYNSDIGTYEKRKGGE